MTPTYLIAIFVTCHCLIIGCQSTLFIDKFKEYDSCVQVKHRTAKCFDMIASKIVVSFDRIESWCQRLNFRNCIKYYVDCVDDTTRKLLNLGANRMQKTLERLCFKPGELQQYRSKMLCLIADQQRSDFLVGKMKDAQKQFATALTRVRDDLYQDEKINGLCCAMDHFTSTLFNYVQNTCSDVNDGEAAHYLKEIIERFHGEMLDLYCEPDYASLCVKEPYKDTLRSFSEKTNSTDISDETAIVIVFEIVSQYFKATDTDDE